MKIRIKPCKGLCGTVTAQPSKNYTTRYLLVSALAEGQSVVRRPAQSDDAHALISCLRALGAEIREQGESCLVKGFGRSPRNPGDLNPRNAGAVLRLLLGVGALLPEARFVTDYPDSLGKRPNQDLLDALKDLGVESESEGGRLPITLRGGNLHGGKARISGANSSQYLSSLLFLAPLVGEDVEIEVIHGLKSGALVKTTLEVMRRAGIRVNAGEDLLHFAIPAGQEYKPGDYEVNGDWPGAAALLSAAAVCAGSDVTIEGLYEDQQGERAIVNVLKDMGADIAYDGHRARIKGGKPLQSALFNGDRATDAVLAMAGAASFARGTSRFYNVDNLRLKECDRITEPVSELCRIGVHAEEKRDEIIIHGNPSGYEGGIEVHGRNDHRVIMLLTIVALGTHKGLTIQGAEHISKSYPDFFRHLESLGARVEIMQEEQV